MSILEIPIPEKMANLPLDRRGYPIPVNVQRDKEGKPQFALNDERVRWKLFKEDRCSICGGKLLRGRWSVGGPGSAFHPDGAFLDPPMHYECARYALQACPYLAMPSYGKSVSGVQPQETKVTDHMITHNPTVFADRPALFALVMFVGQKVNYYDSGLVRSMRPKKPYRQIEYWRNGKQIDDDEGKKIVAKYMLDNTPVWEASMPAEK